MNFRQRIVAVLCGFFTALAAAAPATAQQDRVSATEKGSVLIFSMVLTDRDIFSNEVVTDTFIQITNDYPEGVFVQMYFINGDYPWNWVDNKIYLTPDEPCYWSAATGLPKGVSPFSVLDPGGTNVDGYIIAYACDAEGNEIRHNHLAGTATIVAYADEMTACSYNAWAFQAVDESVEQGGQLPVSGELNFDGVEYSQPFDQLLVPFWALGSAAMSGSGGLVFSIAPFTVLHAVSADLRQESEGPVSTKAHTDIWNENEVKFSGAHWCVDCWAVLLGFDYDFAHVFIEHLHTDMAKARIDGVASQVCDYDEDPYDGLPIGEGYGDILTTDAALLGVHLEFLMFQTGISFVATNVTGMGVQDAQILIDTQPAPPERPADESVTGPRSLKQTTLRTILKTSEAQQRLRR